MDEIFGEKNEEIVLRQNSRERRLSAAFAASDSRAAISRARSRP